MREEEHHPEGASGPCTALQRHPLFQNLHRHGNISIVGPADEQMEMLWHHHIADHRKFVLRLTCSKIFKNRSRREAEQRNGLLW